MGKKNSNAQCHESSGHENKGYTSFQAYLQTKGIRMASDFSTVPPNARRQSNAFKFEIKWFFRLEFYNQENHQSGMVGKPWDFQICKVSKKNFSPSYFSQEEEFQGNKGERWRLVEIHMGETKGIPRLTMKNSKVLQYKSPGTKQSRLESL